MADDTIRETHGMACRKVGTGGSQKASAVVIWEDSHNVFVKGCYEDRFLTPTQAKYLAYKLLRLARRIDNRSEG